MYTLHIEPKFILEKEQIGGALFFRPDLLLAPNCIQNMQDAETTIFVAASRSNIFTPNCKMFSRLNGVKCFGAIALISILQRLKKLASRPLAIHECLEDPRRPLP